MHYLKFIVLTVFITISFQANSQVIIALLFGDKLNNEKISFGLNAGLNYGTINSYNPDDSRAGLNFGLFFNLNLNDRFDFAPELLFINDNGARSIQHYSLGDKDLDSALSTTTINRRLRYMSLPLILNYRVKGQFRVGIGPQFSYLSDARDNFYERDDNFDLSYKHNIKPQLTNYDIGMIGGFAYRFMQGKGIFLKVHYYYGFVPIYDAANAPTRHNQYVQVSVGIPVGATNKKETTGDNSTL